MPLPTISFQICPHCDRPYSMWDIHAKYGCSWLSKKDIRLESTSIVKGAIVTKQKPTYTTPGTDHIELSTKPGAPSYICNVHRAPVDGTVAFSLEAALFESGTGALTCPDCLLDDLVDVPKKGSFDEQRVA